MNILGTIEAPFRWIGGEAKTVVANLVPPDLEAKVALFAHTFTANLIHDFGAEVSTLTHQMVADVWAAMEDAAKSLAPQVMSGKITFAAALSAGVSALKSEAATVMLPALKQTSEQTIKNWLPNLITTSLAAASANPTSQPASWQAVSSPASSGASTK